MSLVSDQEKSSYRMMFRFWLDAKKDDESFIADYCEKLKSERKFIPTIREALRLIRDLRAQRLGVLFELFPWVNAWLEDRAEAIAHAKLAGQSNKHSDDSGHGGGGEGGDITARMERLEQLIIQNIAPAGLLMAAKGSLADQRTGLIKPVDPDAMEIAIQTSNRIPAYEARIGAAKMQNKVDKLPPEVIEYGIRVGSLPAPQKSEKPSPVLPIVAAKEVAKKKGFSFGAKVQSLGQD